MICSYSYLYFISFFRSFNLSNVYQLKEQPVAVDAIVILSTNDVVKRSFGKNM